MPVTSMILFMFSRCFIVTTCLRPRKRRAGIIHVMTIAKPENTAPATKYGGKIVVCQPGMTDVAKSKDTMVWTERHTTIFPPYFVAGAVFSGFAMVMTWMIPA